MEHLVRVSLIFLTMVGVSVSLFVVADVDSRTCGYLVWAFAAASLVQNPTPEISVELKALNLKLPWHNKATLAQRSVS